MTGTFLKKLLFKKEERHLNTIFPSNSIVQGSENVKSICLSHKNFVFSFEKQVNELCGKEMKAY